MDMQQVLSARATGRPSGHGSGWVDVGPGLELIVKNRTGEMVDLCCTGPLKEDIQTVEGNNIVTPQAACELYPPDPLNSMLGMFFGAAAGVGDKILNIEFRGSGGYVHQISGG